MKVETFEDGLAVRLPQAVVEALGLKVGDEVEVIAAGEGRIEVARQEARRAEIVARLRELQKPLPTDYKFDREEANRRQ